MIADANALTSVAGADFLGGAILTMGALPAAHAQRLLMEGRNCQSVASTKLIDLAEKVKERITIALGSRQIGQN